VARRAASSEDPSNRKRRTYISQSDVPRHSVEEALRIPTALAEQFGRKPAKPFYIADAIEMSPKASKWRTLTGAAMAYGLTTGGYNAADIGLTTLGRRIVAPTVDGDDVAAKREAVLKPAVVRAFLERYNDSPLPSERIGRNVLESEMGVDPAKTERTFKLILESARQAGFLKDVGSKTYVDLQATGAPTPDDEIAPEIDEDEDEDEDATTEVTTGPKTVAPADLTNNRRVFITHGKDKKIVEQLKELLAFGEFEPIVSIERESVSKPVPEKVFDDMRSCAAAVIHVGTEQRLLDEKGEEQRVINPNVLIEIGAAMMGYGGRFILLVEKGTTLPSNLQGLYEIRYEGSELDYPATMRLLKAFNEFKG
jgi:predicted nucleotide-binding protein